MDRTFALQFASDWIAAWNAADIERIFQHYADDFEFSSPYISERGFSPDGKLKGKEAMRPYWTAGLRANPPLFFELLGVFAGVDTLSIHYRSRGRKIACETFVFDTHGRVIRSMATHAVAIADETFPTAQDPE